MFLSWIPVIGPIIDGIFGFLNKKTEATVEIRKEDGRIETEGMKYSAQIIRDTKDDISIRICRDILIYPPAIWSALGYWDKIVEHKFPNLVWVVSSFPDGSPHQYLVFATYAFLLGSVGFMTWKRR